MALRNRNPETLAATSRAVADNHPSSGISYPAVQPFQGVMAERSGNSMPVTAGPVVQGYFTWNRGAFRYEQYDMRFWQDSVAILGGASYILEEELKATFGIAAVQRFALGLQSEDDTDITQDAEMQAIINMINNRRRYGATQPVATQPSDRFQTPTHTSFSTVTHNIEKLGASTTHRGEKSEQEGRVLDLLQPDIMTQQEVTRPDLLTNDLRNNRQVSGQYEALEGAKFQSGTYMENYTMQYNTGSIPFVPGLFYIDPSSGDIMPYTGPMSFGKQAAREQEDPDLKQARPNTFWEVQVPVSRLRPAYKHTGNQQGAEDYAKTHSNLRHRSGMQMVRLRLVNVHTSPGKNTPTINQQVNGILEDMETLQEDVHNTLASGDFYMEKKSKRNWKRLHSGTGAFKSLDPGVNTNYVYGQGKQTADHAVVPMDWTDASSHAIPPLETDDTPQSAMERGRDESELAKWEDIKVDHTPVFNRASIPVQDTTTNILEYLVRVFQDAVYRQNNCLIHAIANTAHVALNAMTIQQIRATLAGYGVAPGAFIVANQNNVSVIIHALGLYGVVHIHNVDAPELATAPLWVQAYPGGQLANMDINYSHYHFYAAPRR